MVDRRGFIGSLLALPLISRLLPPKPEPASALAWAAEYEASRARYKDHVLICEMWKSVNGGPPAYSWWIPGSR